jgi:hypothetical protein
MNRKEGAVADRGSLRATEPILTRNKMLPFLIFAVLCMAIFSMPGIEDRALSDVTIAVTPTRIPLSVAADTAQQFEITVINQGNQEASLMAVVEAVSSGENGQAQLSENEECAWFSAESRTLSLLPGESKDFRLSVNVPKNAREGARHFAVSFRMGREDQSGVGLMGGVAVLVDLDVTPKESRGGNAAWIELSILCCAIVGSLLAGLAIRTTKRKHKAASGDATSKEGDRP